ncbi:MAG: tetratricopeptide repeat protein [Candidatus Cloacimonetes bacterium]|nr:tetratricopeptide repeat protein [Candidatus Cloacimonadota bacterium]
MIRNQLYIGLLILLLGIVVFLGCSSGRALPDSQRLAGPARVNMRSGNTYMNLQEYDLALERYLEVVEENPQYIEALKNIGDIYFYYAENRPGQAVSHYNESYNYYNRAINAHEEISKVGDFPQFDDIIDDAQLKRRAAWARLFNLGQERHSQQQDQEALKIFYNLSQLTPDSTNTYIMIASIYQFQGDMDRAADYFKTIAQIDPNDTTSRKNLAAYYFNKQDYPETIRWYEEVVDIDPNDADSYYMMGIVYTNMENKQNEALAAFERAYELDNDFIDAAINAGYIAFDLQKHDKTVFYFKKVIEFEPENKEVLLLLLYTFNYEQNFEDMLEYGQKLYAIDNQSIEAVQFVILAASRLNLPDIQKEYLEILNRLE